MKTNITFQRKCRLAKMAMQLDPSTVSGVKHIIRFARRNRLSTDRLVYYLNAYETAGESGIKALTYNRKLPDSVRLKASGRISAYLRDKYISIPEKYRHGIGFAAEVRGNRITVYERRSVSSDPSRWCRSSAFQVRYTGYDERWHLYWKRASGQWWPFVARCLVRTIDDCIRQVELNKECFWG